MAPRRLRGGALAGRLGLAALSRKVSMGTAAEVAGMSLRSITGDTFWAKAGTVASKEG